MSGLETRAEDMESGLRADLGTIERRLQIVLRGSAPGIDAKTFRLHRVLDHLAGAKAALQGCLMPSKE